MIKFNQFHIASGLGVAVVLGMTMGGAVAYDDSVTTHCTSDYLSYCKQHPPESSEVRYCMEAHRNQLSKQCIKALVDAGQVPKKYLTRQAGDKR